MRILFVGDIVGRSGRSVVYERLPNLVRDWKLDLVVANGENSAGGFGITETIYRDLIDCGIDAVTLGNHAFDLVSIDGQLLTAVREAAQDLVNVR